MSNEFVKVYHNVIPDDFCDKMIKQYEDRISRTEKLLNKVLEKLESSSFKS